MKLETVVPADIEWVSDGVDRWDCSARWSLRGRTPPPGVLHDLLWNGVPVQQAVRADDGRPIGLLQATDLDLHHGVGQICLLVDPEQAGQVQPALVAFLERVFRDFPVRKLMVGAPSDAAGLELCLGSVARPIARLVGHQRRTTVDYVDLVLYEVDREGLAA